MQAAEQRQVFTEWLGQHQGLILKIVRAYAFTDADRDDLFQEVCTQLWISVAGFQGDSQVSTWIYRVALFTATAWTRKERKHRRTESKDEAPERSWAFTVPPADPRLDWLYEQIAKFDPPDRSLFLLMLEGYSQQEIAETLGITKSNVGVRVHRIKKKLAALSTEVA